MIMLNLFFDEVILTALFQEMIKIQNLEAHCSVG